MSYLESLFSLEGKTAIITGASRGLGRASAEALSAAGANVVLVGRDTQALQEVQSKIGEKRSLLLTLDVKEPQSAISAITSSIDRFGGLDILINNAGIIRRAAAIDYSAHDWYDVIDTDLNAVFSWAQAAGKVMNEQGSGKIVNVASLLSFQGGLNIAAYAAAKGGVAQLTKALANEWAKYNINVNAIAPGYIRTNATAALRADNDRSKQILSRIPAGRWGEPRSEER